MSPRLPRVTASEIIRVLERIGFVQVRQSGPKVLKSILRDADLTTDELLKLLGKRR